MLVVVELQVADQPGDVGQMILVVGFGQFDIDFFHRRQEEPLFLQIVEVHLPDACFAPRDVALAQHAGVDGRFHGHPDHHIFRDRRPAGQAVTLFPVGRAQFFAEASFYRSGFHNDPAFAADTLSTA
jgi:hypothetical protein